VAHDLEVTVDIRRLAAPAQAAPVSRASSVARQLQRDDEAAIRRAEEDRHQQQQQQQQ
jgi:hypothetical protein